MGFYILDTLNTYKKKLMRFIDKKIETFLLDRFEVVFNGTNTRVQYYTSLFVTLLKVK